MRRTENGSLHNTEPCAGEDHPNFLLPHSILLDIKGLALPLPNLADVGIHGREIPGLVNNPSHKPPVCIKNKDTKTGVLAAEFRSGRMDGTDDPAWCYLPQKWAGHRGHCVVYKKQVLFVRIQSNGAFLQSSRIPDPEFSFPGFFQDSDDLTHGAAAIPAHLALKTQERPLLLSILFLYREP